MEKLLAIASLGRKAYGRWLFQRMLLSIIAIAGLMLIIAIIVSAMLIGGLCTTYVALLHYGIEPQGAIAIVTLLTILIILFLVSLVLAGLRHIRQMPGALLSRSPITSSVMVVLNAFTDGLMAD